MENNIIEFNKKTEIKNKDFSIYKDEEKGIEFVLNTVNIIARCDYLELDKQQYEAALFAKKIEDLKYDIINVTRPTSKYELTKKEEDKFKIVDNEVAVRPIWNVTNNAGAFKSFTNKEDAIKLVEEINNKVFEIIL